jgi:hypothetical protein
MRKWLPSDSMGRVIMQSQGLSHLYVWQRRAASLEAPMLCVKSMEECIVVDLSMLVSPVCAHVASSARVCVRRVMEGLGWVKAMRHRSACVRAMEA